MAGGPGYASKPRPALIVQSDSYATDLSITTCGFTREVAERDFSRPLVEPSPVERLARTEQRDGRQGSRASAAATSGSGSARSPRISPESTAPCWSSSVLIAGPA